MKLEQLLKNEQKKALSLGKEESAVVLYMMHVTGYTSSQLFMHIHDKATDEVIKKFENEFSKYLYENKPIQYASHDDDGDWQFLCCKKHVPEEARIVALSEIIRIQKNVIELSDLNYGEYAEAQNGKWIIHKKSHNL